jgi:hypothetical protein
MPMNRIQFQSALSLPAFHAQFGTEAQCEAPLWRGPPLALVRRRAHDVPVSGLPHTNVLIAGTLFRSTHLALSVWFLATRALKVTIRE